MSDPDDDDRDADRASAFLGKRVLAGLTYRDRSGAETRRQVHGVIVRIDAREGVVIALPNGEAFRLPPDLDGYERAAPGRYTLSSTGEIVEDPDLVGTWVIELSTRH
jgi:hypothetical protein